VAAVFRMLPREEEKTAYTNQPPPSDQKQTKYG